VTYYYDQTSYNGLTISNGKGLRTGMSDGSGQTAWSYDTMGRVVTEQRTIGTVTKTMSYSYNYDGSLASITYPSGRVVSYTYGGDSRRVSAVDSADSINYATSATYAPPGGLASIVNGEVSGGFAGITTSNSYNNRLLPTLLSASSSNGTALSLSYTYFANRNVNVETNGRDNGRSVTYTYDALNRVSTATSQATSGSDCWGQSFGYDRYANLTTVNVTQCTAPMLSLSVNTNNQITSSGFSYDAAGDLTGDGTYTYSWNAERRLNSAANVTYTYDGNLRRVKKSSGTLYWLSPAGAPLAETDTSGNTLNEYVFFGSARIARRDSSGNVYYYFRGHLGTTATLSNSSGVLCYDADFLPFGYEMAHTASCAQNYKFTGLERDSETGLDHTLNRKYDSGLGRWLTPDPKAGNPLNPQSWNRYAYALNNPATLTDPLGLEADEENCYYSTDGVLECSQWYDSDDGGDDEGGGDEGDDGGVDSGVGGVIPVVFSPNPPGPWEPPMPFPYSIDKYINCSKQCFGNYGGDFSVNGVLSGSELQLSYTASNLIDMAAQLTGGSVATIAGTYLLESGGGNLAPANSNTNGNGTVDIGPMQLSYLPGSNLWSPLALGTSLGPKQPYNGNAWLNIFEGANYLASLADPGWYVSGANPTGAKGIAAANQRDANLAALAPDLKKFFDCLNK